MNRSRLIALAAMLFFVAFVAASASAANITSNGTGGGTWGSTATWAGGVIPGSGDNVTITGIDVVTVVDARTCNSLQLDTTSGSKTLNVSGAGALVLQATGNALLINAPLVGTHLVQLNGGAITIPNGDIQIAGGISNVARLDFNTGGGTFTAQQMLFTGNSSNAQVTFSGGSGTVFLSGNLGAGGNITSGGSTFNFNGSGAQTINGYTFHNLTIAKSNTATLNGPIFVNGDLTISSGLLDDGGNQITLNAGGTSLVNIGSTGVLKLGAAASATSFPLNVNPGNIFFSPNSVVVYHAGLTQTINTAINYRRLYLTTTGGNVTHSFTGTLNVAEDLTVLDNGVNTTALSVGSGSLDVNTDISGDGDISVTTGFIGLGGNWNNAVGLTAGATSTITYDGTGAQNVRAATYGNLSITKISGTATLAGATITNGALGISGGGTLATNNNPLTVSGAFSNSATFDAGTSNVTFLGDLTNTVTVLSSNATFILGGATPQVWSSNPGAITVSGLQISNSSGVTIGNNTSVNGALTLNGGKVTINGSFFIDVAATVTRTSGWFVGPLTMGFNTSPVRRMHVGTSAAYLPIDLDAGSAGMVTARAVEGAHPNKTGPRVLARYWTLEAPSNVVPIDSLTFQYSLSDVASGTESEFMLARYSSGWIRHGDLVAEGPHTATITNISTYVGDWVVGHAGSMGGAGFLKITQVNGGVSPTVNTPFNVGVQARTDDDSAPGNTFLNTTVDVLLAVGTGSLLTSSGTINAGTNSVTVNNLTYDTAESNVQLDAQSSSGDAIDPGTSAPFNVLAAPSTLTVSSINDAGPGTLRDAIDTANLGGCASPCTINFSTSGTIILASALSPITRDDLTINGYSAPSATPNTNAFGLPDNANITVQLDGSSTIGIGLEIQGQNDVIKGFVIKNFTTTGVKFTGTNNGSIVEGCFIGTDASGNNAAPNGDGVGFVTSSNGTVGGTSAAARNVISGNGMYGIYAGTSSINISMYGNYVGVRKDLTGALANDDGIEISIGSSANIGMLGGGNLISGNTGNGIEINGSASVLANLIGTNGNGTTAIPNDTGIFISPGASGTTIGPTELNVISGNTNQGIEIQGDSNSVANAYVGVGSDGTTSIPNGGIGVRISGSATNNSIGVLAANKIAHNVGQGVSVATSALLVGNAIRTNKIFSNGVQGIDLGEDGPTPTPNDATDADGGANGLQNFPTISAAQISGPNVQLTVSIDSSGNPSGTAALIFDVYKADASSPEQALEYLGNSGCLAGTVFSNYVFTVPQGTVVNGSKIVATATSYQAGCATLTDGTSELSAAATVSGAIHWINGSGGNWSTASNWNPAQVPTASDEVYIDAGGSYTVAVSTSEAAGILHVGTGVSGTQTLAVTNTGSLSLGSASDVTTTGAMSVVGTLSGTGLLAVNGVFNWDGGTLSGSTGLTINSGGLLTINNAVAHVLNQRTLTIASGATVNWNAGSVSMLNGAKIDNLGTFEVKTDNSIADAGFASTFDNHGLFRKSVTAGSTSFTNIALNHISGTVDIQTGTLDLAGGTSNAAIAISSGATMLINSDTYTLGNGTSVTGLGKIHITGGTLDVTGASVSVEHLYLQGGTLGGAGTITGVFGNTWQWDGGTMQGGGTTIVPGGATLLAGTASAKSLNQRTLQIQGSGTLTFGGTGTLNLLNGGNINNAGIFDIIGDAVINDAGFAGSITNSGTFKKSGTAGGTTSLSNVTIANSGTINIQTGTLDPADLNNTGTITNAGTLLVNSNTVTLGAGSSVGGAGLVQVTNGTLTVNAAVTFPNLQLDGGTINGTAVFNATALAWNGGTMGGTGTTNIPAAASATIAGSSTKTLNQRSFNVAPSGIATFAGTGSIDMLNGANITNNGLFEITGTGGFNDASFAGSIANTGTFRKSTSTNTTTLSNINFNHSGGTLDVQTGTFDLAGGTSSAAIALSSGTTFLVNSNTYTFAAGTTVTGAGLVTVSGGTLSVTGNVAIPQFNLSGGTLDGNGTTTLTNVADWSGGTMQGGGTTTVDPSATLTITTGSGKNLNNRTLATVIGGTVTASGSGTINLLNGGNVSNAGLFHFTGDAAVNDAGFGGAFANTGTLRKSTSTNTTSFSNVNLNHSGGTLDLQTGTLDLAGGTSSAPIALASGATLLFNSNTYTLANGTTFSGTGMVSLQGGTLSVTGNISIPTFGMTAGTLDGAGSLFLTNVADWSGGTMQGGGATTVTASATLTMSSPSNKALNNRTLSTLTNGTIDVTGGGTLNFLNGGNVNNAGTFVTDIDSTFADAGFGGGFTNTGTFRKQTTTGPTTFTNVALTNNGGLIDLQTGTLSASSFIQSAAGTLKVRLGGTAPTAFSKLTTTSTPTLAGTLQVTLAGLYQPIGGDTFQILTTPGGAHSGDFIQPYTYPALSGGRTFSDAYNGNGLVLTVSGFADLSITKSAASNNYPVSAPISYTLTVTNADPDMANSVSVSDTLPTGHTGISASGTGWNCNVVSDTVTCNATAPLPMGAAPNITINATTPSTPQTFTNTATVSSTNDSNGTNNSGTWIVTINPNTVDLDLSSVSPASPVAQSTGFTFDFTIKNNGPQTATGVVFTAPIPSTLTYSSSSPTQGPPCTFVSNTVSCSLGTIASGGSPHVVLNLVAGTTPGTHYVTGSGTANEADTNLTNNSIPTPVQVIGATVVVTNTNDSGAGSLRQALLDAQNTSGCPAPCAITFNIGSGPFVIQPQSDLPAVAASALVDATTQPGYSGTPIIQVDGTLTPTTSLFTLSAGGATVKGFSLTNATKGVWINSNNNVVTANYIGVTPAGANGGNANGIVINGSNNRIGGTSGGANKIEFNTNNGIDAVTGAGNEITGNSIGSNTLLGIDLGNDGVTPNDATDADTGPNNLQNFPTVTGAFLSGGNLQVNYNLNSSGAANVGSVLVEIFEADSAPSGEGLSFLTRVCQTSDNFGVGTSFAAPSVAAGDPIVLTATAYSDASCATISDGTSEFSNVVLATNCTPPPATLNAPPSACANTTTNAASVTAPTATQYNWIVTGGALLSGQGTANIVFSAPASGSVNLSVTVTDTNGCTNTQSTVVPVTTAPAPVITAPNSVCASSTGHNASVAPGATSYVWTITNGTITSGQNTNAITFSANASGTVALGVTASNGSCSGNASKNVTITPPPVVNILGPTAACGSSTFTLDAGAGFATYQWSTGDTTRFITVTQSAPSVTYTVTVTDTNSCSTSDSHTVTLGGSPDANINVAATVAASSTNNPASVLAQPGATYLWSIVNGAITDGNGTNSILFTAGTSGNVDINVTVSIGGCIGNGAAGVMIDGGSPAPTTDFSVVKQAPVSVKPGDPIAWKVIVSNIGSSASAGQLVDTLPAGVTVNSVSGGSWNCTRTATQITCTGSLAPQASTTIDIAATAPQQTGVIQNRADVTTTVTDTNPSNNSATASTNVVQVITCPANAPALLTPAANASIQSSELFSWSSVAGASLYELWITSNGTTTLAASTASTSAANLQLASGPGSWFVVARGGAECDALATATRNFTVQQASNCGTHGAPQLVAPSEGATTGPQVNVSWMPVPQAIGYRVWIEVNGTAAQDIGATNGAINLNVTLPPGAIALYVDALFAGCPSTRSNIVHFTVSADPCAQRGTAALLSPANNATLGSSLVEFRWTPAANAAASRVWISRNGGAFAVAGETGSDTLSTYVQDGEIRWFVEELFDGCASTASDQRRFVIPAGECELGAPTLLSPANGAVLTGALAQIRWTAQSGAVAYEVWMSFEGAVASLVETTTGTAFDYLLPEAGVYDVFVRALGDGCPSRDSLSRRFRYAPPVACGEGEQAILIAPIDGEHVTSPATFSWSAREGATRYELYTTRGNGAPQLAATTFDTEATIALANGHVAWFVRTYFGNCSPADSEERDLLVVGPPNACDPLTPPMISTPGEISSGIEFLLLWNKVPGATSYELQIASSSDFGGAQDLILNDTSYALTRINNGNAPIAVYARVRAIDGRCRPLPNVSAYGPTSVIFILPRTGTIASVPLEDPAPVHYTINLGPEFAGQSFSATPTEDWLSVSPTSGTVAANGTNLDVTANPAGLGVGGHSGAISIALNSASSRLTTHGSVPTTVTVNLVTPVTPAPANTPSPDTMIIPAVANADGINSHFQSDVRVANTSAKLIKYQLNFIPSGDAGISAGRQTTFSIEPGRTVALDDILKSWFGTGTSNAVGVLQIKPLTTTSSSVSSVGFGPLANLVSFASSRTFNVTPTGTFGQYIPAVPYANFADKSTVLSLQQIAQSAKTRSNLGLVEGSGNPADLLIKVFNGSGQMLTSFTTRLNGGQHTQLNSFLLDKGIQLDDGRVEVQVTSSTGKVTAYASVLDNETSDAVLVTPVALGSQGNTKWVLPGVADIRSGFADWQSDVRVFNAGTSSANVTASFYSQGGGEPKVQTITLGPGEVKQLDKILPTLFGVTNDGGALHLSTATASRIIATARTYNQTTKGTYGQFINGVTPQEAVAVGTRPLQLLQVEESPRMRSNVGVVEVTGKPVKLEVTVTPPDAKFAAVIEVDLGANEYRQMNSLLAGLGLGDTYNARVSVRAVSGEGRATTFASVIDLATNDPTFVMPQ